MQMSFVTGKRLFDDVSESEYSDNFEDSDSGSPSSSNEKISNINPKKRFRRNNPSELSKQFQNAIYSKMAVSKEAGNMSQHLDKNYETGSNRRKCYSKNALNARENRLKKKVYVENLEKTVEKFQIKNKQLSVLLENQTNMLSDMKKQVKYFKSIIANSQDISQLLKCLNQTTGMPVTSSINKNISTGKPHPWAETTKNSCLNSLENCGFVDDSEFNFSLDTYLSDSPLSFEETVKLPDDSYQVSNEESIDEDLSLQWNNEHNYNAKSPDSFEVQDFGVCLHISNHKMSLEFCPTCSENATSTWKV